MARHETPSVKNDICQRKISDIPAPFPLRLYVVKVQQGLEEHGQRLSLSAGTTGMNFQGKTIA